MSDPLHEVQLTFNEICLLHNAIREYRTTVPEHIKNDAIKLARWNENRDLYSEEIQSTDRKLTNILAELFDESRRK